jgi:hypothetical protein
LRPRLAQFPVIDPREIWPTVEDIVSRRFEGSTITEGRGRWQGRGEPSLVVELWRRASERHQFFSDAVETSREIASALDQVTIAVVTRDGQRQSVTYLGARVEPSRRRRSAQNF